MTVSVFLGCAGLWAQQELPQPRPRFGDVFWPSLPWFIAMALVLLVGGAVLALVDRWRKGSSRPAREDVSIAAWLRECRLQRDRGEITQEEYERIRGKLTGKSPAKAAAPADAPPPAPPGDVAGPPAVTPPGPPAD